MDIAMKIQSIRDIENIATIFNYNNIDTDGMTIKLNVTIETYRLISKELMNSFTPFKGVLNDLTIDFQGIKFELHHEQDCGDYDIDNITILGVHIKLVGITGSNWKSLLTLEDKNISKEVGSFNGVDYLKKREEELIKRGSKVVISTRGDDTYKGNLSTLSDNALIVARARRSPAYWNDNFFSNDMLKDMKNSIKERKSEFISNGTTGIWCDRDFSDREMYQIMGYACAELGMSLGPGLWDKCNEANMKIGAGSDFEGTITNISIKELKELVMNEPKEFRPKYDKLNNVQKKSRSKSNRKHKRRK